MMKESYILEELIRVAERYEKECQGLYTWEIPALHHAKKWLAELNTQETKYVCDNKPCVIHNPDVMGICFICGKKVE